MMIRDEILKANPVALTVEAHRILGLTIEKYESSPGRGRDSWKEYTIWRAVFKDGSEWGRVYCDCENEIPNEELLNRLNVEHFAASWDSASNLLCKWPEQSVPPEGILQVNIYVRTTSQDDNITATIDAGYPETTSNLEEDFATAITRSFLLAHAAAQAKAAT